MIDTSNKFVVANQGDSVLILNPPRGRISKEDALVLAAYLVTLSMATVEEFEEALKAVQNT